MEEDTYKEVYFDQYCKKCKYEDTLESDDPCFDCLDNVVNLYSHRPFFKSIFHFNTSLKYESFS